jgi:hypothetical protein
MHCAISLVRHLAQNLHIFVLSNQKQGGFMKKQIVSHILMGFVALLFVLAPALSQAGPVVMERTDLMKESVDRVVEAQVQPKLDSSAIIKSNLQLLLPKVILESPELTAEKKSLLKHYQMSVLPKFSGVDLADRDVILESGDLEPGSTVQAVATDFVVDSNYEVIMVGGTALIPHEQGQWYQAGFVAKLPGRVMAGDGEGGYIYTHILNKDRKLVGCVYDKATGKLDDSSGPGCPADVGGLNNRDLGGASIVDTATAVRFLELDRARSSRVEGDVGGRATGTAGRTPEGRTTVGDTGGGGDWEGTFGDSGEDGALTGDSNVDSADNTGDPNDDQDAGPEGIYEEKDKDDDDMPNPMDPDGGWGGPKGRPLDMLGMLTSTTVYVTIETDVNGRSSVSLYPDTGEGGGRGPADPVNPAAMGAVEQVSAIGTTASVSMCPTTPRGGGGTGGDPVPTISSPVSSFASKGSVGMSTGDSENGICPDGGDPLPVSVIMDQVPN